MMMNTTGDTADAKIVWYTVKGDLRADATLQDKKYAIEALKQFHPDLVCTNLLQAAIDAKYGKVPLNTLKMTPEVATEIIARFSMQGMDQKVHVITNNPQERHKEAACFFSASCSFTLGYHLSALGRIIKADPKAYETQTSLPPTFIRDCKGFGSVGVLFPILECMCVGGPGGGCKEKIAALGSYQKAAAGAHLMDKDGNKIKVQYLYIPGPYITSSSSVCALGTQPTVKD